MDRSFGKHTHFELARLEPIKEDAHTFFHFGRVGCLFEFSFNFPGNNLLAISRRDRSDLCFIGSLINNFHRKLIYIQANKNTDFLDSFKRLIQLKETACSEISDENIEELRVAFQNGGKSAI